MKEGQVFGIATYDALFKWVLSDSSVRPSFFHAFIPNLCIQSSERIDEHMNPLQDLQLLRELLHHEDTSQLVTHLYDQQSQLKVHVGDLYHGQGTDLLKALLNHFADIQYAFPKAKFDGTMDFVCRLNTGEYALVEMQIMPEEHWDDRALGYVAAIFSRQLRKRSSWKNIQKVIGINILGGGKDNQKHWKDTPEQYSRHYKFQEQIHNKNPPRYMCGIEIIQYSLSNVPDQVETQERKDWLRFFKNAHRMVDDDVRREIQTPAVIEAFELARLRNLPADVKRSYEEEDALYVNLSSHIADEIAEAVAKAVAETEARVIAETEARAKEEKINLARELLLQGFDAQKISEMIKLPLNIIKNL